LVAPDGVNLIGGWGLGQSDFREAVARMEENRWHKEQKQILRLWRRMTTKKQIRANRWVTRILGQLDFGWISRLLL